MITRPQRSRSHTPISLNTSTVSEDELKTYVHDRLARFKTPRDVVFTDNLPRTATGKIIKRELRESFWGGKERRVQG